MENVTQLEFDALLSVLYSSCVPLGNMHIRRYLINVVSSCFRAPKIVTFQEWSAVLRLASEWSFEDIRSLAIERLEPLATPVDRITLSHTFNIPQWLSGAYVELCQRPRSLAAADIRVLAAEDVELIMAVRETTLRLGGVSGPLAIRNILDGIRATLSKEFAQFDDSQSKDVVLEGKQCMPPSSCPSGRDTTSAHASVPAAVGSLPSAASPVALSPPPPPSASSKAPSPTPWKSVPANACSGLTTPEMFSGEPPSPCRKDSCMGKGPTDVPLETPVAASFGLSAASSEAPHLRKTPTLVVSVETMKAANTPHFTSTASHASPEPTSRAASPIHLPKPAEVPLPAVSKVPTPAVSKAPSKARAPAASKAPSKTPPKALISAEGLSKVASRIPSSKKEPETLLKPSPPELKTAPPASDPQPAVDPTPAPKDPNDDSVIPPRPDEPFYPTASDGQPAGGAQASTHWFLPDPSPGKLPNDHGLGDLWGGNSKTAGFSDFLTSNANWSKPAFAVSTSKRNSSAFGCGSSDGSSGWESGLGEWSATAASAATGGWGSFTNALALGSNEGEDPVATLASPTVPDSFGSENTKNLKLDLPPVAPEQIAAEAGSAIVTPGRSKAQKQKTKKKAAEEARKKASGLGEEQSVC